MHGCLGRGNREDLQSKLGGCGKGGVKGGQKNMRDRKGEQGKR